MKTRLVPISFPNRDDEFDRQMEQLRRRFGGEAEFLPEIPIGAPVPEGADAVVVPQLLGDAYRCVSELADLRVPIIIITSEFGTLSMWDWEIIEFLRQNGVRTLAPYSDEQARLILRAVRTRSRMRGGVFLMYQDNPGEGQQASIFKRFWWWEESCRIELEQRLGVRVVYRSYGELGKRLAEIDDAAAIEEWKRWNYPASGLSQRAPASAAKLYLAVRADLSEFGDDVLGVGINCLNESHFAETTPCAAWSILFEETGIMWACEADIVSLATKYMIYKSLEVPIVMTNIYPFLMGMAALKHEKIPSFPEIVDNPDDHVLVAHCGYFALMPRSFASKWTLRPSVLEIVHQDSNMMDARFPIGPVTFAKLDPHFRKLFVTEGSLKGYVQYSGSDCRNGGVIEVADGHALMRRAYSHHKCLMTGHTARDLQHVADVFALDLDPV